MCSAPVVTVILISMCAVKFEWLWHILSHIITRQFYQCSLLFEGRSLTYEFCIINSVVMSHQRNTSVIHVITTVRLLWWHESPVWQVMTLTVRDDSALNSPLCHLCCRFPCLQIVYASLKVCVQYTHSWANLSFLDHKLSVGGGIRIFQDLFFEWASLINEAWLL